MFNLFALTNDPATRVVRFKLSQKVQTELTAYLKLQEAEFEKSSKDVIPFDGKYKPDDGEALLIDSFDDIDSLGQSITNPLGVQEIVATEEVFGSIKALFSGYVNGGVATVLIQYFDKRKIISTSGMSLYHSKNEYKKIEGVGITIDTKLSAVLKGNKLQFFSFHLVRQIFDLSEYYLEATDNDINEFAALPLIKVDDLPGLISMSDSWVRRKVSLIQQSQILQTVPLNDIKAVAIEFNIALELVQDAGAEMIKLPSTKAELKTLLRFLDEDYYKSPLSKVQYLTNSKRLV